MAEGEEEEHHKNPFLCSKPSSPKLQFRKEVSVARWDEELGMGEIIEKKGSMWTNTGIVRNVKLYCHIEEIMFLAEKGALVLTDVDETTLTLRDIYKKIASEAYGCSWEAFEAYRHLKSLGFIVGRHGTLWSLKSIMNCSNSISLESTSDYNERSENGMEEVSTLFKDMQITKLWPTFDVYLPNSNFRKTSPGDPNHVLCVVRENPPTRIEVEEVQKKCGSIPLKFCSVEHGRVSFFLPIKLYFRPCHDYCPTI